MKIEKLKENVYLARIGLIEKDELETSIIEALQTLDKLEKEKKKAKDILDCIKKQNELVENNQIYQKTISDEYGTEYEVSLNYDNLVSICKEYSENIEILQQSLINYKNFNKNRCFENIRFLLKEKSDVKIGQIEKKASVSPGYMSRLEKASNTSEPSVEFLVTAAKMLGVSLDVLLLTDMVEMNPTEKYLANLIQKLNQDTIDDKLEWNRESDDSLNRLETDINGFVNHPLFEKETFYEQGETEYPNLVERIVFKSHSFDCHTCINDDCFNLSMKNNSTLYLMNVSKGVYHIDDLDAFAKEIWIFTPGMTPQYLTSNRDISRLAELVEILFDTVKRASQHPKIKKNIKNVLDAFINFDDLGEEDDDDDMPF